MTRDDIDRLKYIICCPMCDNDKCVRRTDACEAEQWANRKKDELEWQNLPNCGAKMEENR